jgi:hypothetical protein
LQGKPSPLNPKWWYDDAFSGKEWSCYGLYATIGPGTWRARWKFEIRDYPDAAKTVPIVNEGIKSYGTAGNDTTVLFPMVTFDQDHIRTQVGSGKTWLGEIDSENFSISGLFTNCKFYFSHGGPLQHASNPAIKWRVPCHIMELVIVRIF